MHELRRWCILAQWTALLALAAVACLATADEVVISEAVLRAVKLGICDEAFPGYGELCRLGEEAQRELNAAAKAAMDPRLNAPNAALCTALMIMALAAVLAGAWAFAWQALRAAPTGLRSAGDGLARHWRVFLVGAVGFAAISYCVVALLRLLPSDNDEAMKEQQAAIDSELSGVGGVSVVGALLGVFTAISGIDAPSLTSWRALCAVVVGWMAFLRAIIVLVVVARLVVACMPAEEAAVNANPTAHPEDAGTTARADEARALIADRAPGRRGASKRR
jgi:hypothetical protein